MIVKPVKEVVKPWGGELWVAVTDSYALKIIVIKKGQRSSLQYHERKHEHIYIDTGRVKAELQEPDGQLRTFECGPGTIIENAPGQRHRLEALEDTRLIEVQTPFLDDVVRVEDDYKRGVKA
ncbi:MAG: cupin [Kiritimatiellae bacterium]|nr:cupin [Kiritimatiellia bacterium]